MAVATLKKRIKHVALGARQFDLPRVVFVALLEEVVVVNHEVLQAAEGHVVIHGTLLLGKHDNRTVDFTALQLQVCVRYSTAADDSAAT